MPDQLEFGGSHRTGYGVRREVERRNRDRRAGPRTVPGRRRAERRRQKIRTLLLAAAAFGASHNVKSKPLQPAVAVSMDSFTPVRPDRAYDSFIAEAATKYRLDPELIRAVMRAESGFDPMVVSSAGAEGLMQLMPALANEMGVTDSFDPRQNIMGGARYLRWLLDRHRGNVRLTLASYNAGPTAVDRYKAVPPFQETQRYVRKITGFLADAHANSSKGD
jgi:soluble lytic murein transglycosylase-like protein